LSNSTVEIQAAAHHRTGKMMHAAPHSYRRSTKGSVGSRPGFAGPNFLRRSIQAAHIGCEPLTGTSDTASTEASMYPIPQYLLESILKVSLCTSPGATMVRSPPNWA
jgi:hypothetical protein